MRSDVLVVDIGSARLKAARYSSEDGLLDVAAIDSPLEADRVDARAILDAIALIAGTLLDGMLPSAIAITGATRTHVLTGHDGRALDAVVKPRPDAVGAGPGCDARRVLAHTGGALARTRIGLGCVRWRRGSPPKNGSAPGPSRCSRLLGVAFHGKAFARHGSLQ